MLIILSCQTEMGKDLETEELGQEHRWGIVHDLKTFLLRKECLPDDVNNTGD